VCALPSGTVFVQNKKELTISGIYVDKMRNQGIFRRYYNRIFTVDENALKKMRNILLIS
jgi:hypothetical protein